MRKIALTLAIISACMALTAVAGPRTRLAPRDRWRTIPSPGLFLVSPRWNPHGQGLVASGRLGKGLYLFQHNRLTPLDPAYMGPTSWSAQPHILCLESNEGPRQISLAGQAIPGACPAQAQDETLGVLIHGGPEHRLYHNAYLGTITLVAADGSTQILEDRLPWGVEASPDGRSLAYSMGRLSNPSLYLHRLNQGTILLGRGTQPCWFPDSKRLVYAVPGRRMAMEGFSSVETAEIHLYDPAEGVVPLTATPDLAEMQPRLSPRGDELAFSDWRAGTIVIAPLLKEGDHEN